MNGRSFRRFVEVSRKELRYLTTQKAFTLISLIAPLMGFFVFFLLLQPDITLPVEVLEPRSPAAAEFVDHMDRLRNPAATRYFDVETVTHAEANASLEAGERVALIEVPEEPLLETARGTELALTVHYGNVNTNLIKNIIDRVNIACVRFLEEKVLGRSRVTIHERTIYGVDVDWVTFMTTGIYVYALLLSGSISGGVTMTKELEGKTMTLLRLAPRGMAMVYAGKSVAALFLTTLATLVFITAASLLHGFMPEDLALFAGASGELMLIAVLMGLCAGLVIRSSLALFIALLVTNLAMWVVGGGFGLRTLFATPVKAVSAVVPTTYGIRLIRQAVLGAGFSCTVDIAALLVFIVVLAGGLYFIHKFVVERV